MKTSCHDFSIGDFYNVEGIMVVQVRQAPHEVLLPASGEIHSVALDKGKPAGKPLGTGKEKRAKIKLLEKRQRRKPCADAKGTVAFSRGRCSFLKKTTDGMCDFCH